MTTSLLLHNPWYPLAVGTIRSEGGRDVYCDAVCGATFKHKHVLCCFCRYNAWFSLAFGAIYIEGGAGSC